MRKYIDIIESVADQEERLENDMDWETLVGEVAHRWNEDMDLPAIAADLSISEKEARNALEYARAG